MNEWMNEVTFVLLCSVVTLRRSENDLIVVFKLWGTVCLFPLQWTEDFQMICKTQTDCSWKWFCHLTVCRTSFTLFSFCPAAGGSDVSSCLQDLSLGESQEDVPVLRPFFISVVEEADLGGEEDDLQHAQQLLKEYERREGVTVGELEDGEGGGGEEKYEKTRARHGDAVFSRFMKRISLCPQQILRYCRGGKPLFISEPPSNMAQVVPACGSCGGSRTFELQLMPALVSLLQRMDGGAEAQLEFGTVLVYTCRNSCWTAGSRSAVEEFCFVQTDPDQNLFKWLNRRYNRRTDNFTFKKEVNLQFLHIWGSEGVRCADQRVHVHSSDQTVVCV